MNYIQNNMIRPALFIIFLIFQAIADKTILRQQYCRNNPNECHKYYQILFALLSV